LILTVETVIAGAVSLLPRRDALRQLVRLTAGEAVLQPVARVIAEQVGHFVRRLVAGLDAVRTGDVGRRRLPDVVGLVVVTQARKAVIEEVRNRDTCGDVLLHDRDERRLIECPLGGHPTPAAQIL
jgi:hypothetical protein